MVHSHIDPPGWKLYTALCVLQRAMSYSRCIINLPKFLVPHIQYSSEFTRCGVHLVDTHLSCGMGVKFETLSNM